MAPREEPSLSLAVYRGAMHIVIAGGHGKIALLLSRLLADAGHRPTGLIRDPEQSADLRSAGAEPVVLDLEKSTKEQVASALTGADAVVFAAGSGPDSGPERKLTVDRDGAVLLAEAAVAAGVRRFVVVSSIGADEYDPSSNDGMQIYLKAKSEADAAVRALDLDWTIVRPGGLTNDEPTGLVTVAERSDRSSISRADVAAVFAAVLETDQTIGKQFEVVGGSTPIAEALTGLGGPTKAE
ncbi:SDR family oxidoreductase [Marisediminicola antarctica]